MVDWEDFSFLRKKNRNYLLEDRRQTILLTEDRFMTLIIPVLNLICPLLNSCEKSFMI